MTTPEQHLEQLRERALAADVEPVTEPDELARRSLHSLLLTSELTPAPDRPEVDVRLHGPAVPGHEIAVRNATAILTALQEAIAAIGQAIRHTPTSRGSIQSDILRATELRMSPSLGAGSVVFHLSGAAEEITGDEAAELTGSDTLVDAAVGSLFALLEQSNADDLESSTLTSDLRRLGPRTAKHLSDLSKRVVDDEIDIDLRWRNPAGHRRTAALQRRAALAIRDAIERNRVETDTVQLTGTLLTVSVVAKAELQLEDQDKTRVRLAVSPDDAPTLGPFFDKRVVATAERTTKWSTNTGIETRSYRLLELRLAEAPGASDLPSHRWPPVPPGGETTDHQG